MTTPRIFTDNKAGNPYLFGEFLPHANASNIESALRRLDKAFYRTMTQNWDGPIPFDIVTVPSSHAIVFDATLGLWAFAYREAGNVSVHALDTSFSHANNGIVGATAAPVRSSASNDLGCMVFGLAPSGATASKILQSNDALNWTLRTIGSIDTKAVSFIRWDATNARFVALVSTGEAYTSSDGVTWNVRTVPVGLAAVTWTGLAISRSGFCVATASGTANYMTSADGGINWTQRVGPATGADITYAPGVGTAGTFAHGTSFVSADGINWSAMSVAPLAAATGVCRLYGVGPTFVAITTMIGGSGGGARVELAYDQGNPTSWATVAAFTPSDGFGGNDYFFASQNQIALVAQQSTNAVFFHSLSMGY